MSSYNSISIEKLSRLIGTSNAPTLIDVRTDEDFAAEARLIPGAQRRSHRDIQDWAGSLGGKSVVVICQKGQKLSEGTAAWLRHANIAAEILEGGHLAWKQAELPTIPVDKIPNRDGRGRTVWVTRERPKIDRIACPWLIRRFVDPAAVVLFVASAEVVDVAERFNATPFDIENVFWSHRGELCTFDVMVREFGLSTPALDRLATMVRAADTARLELSPEAPGLLAASLGLSRMYDDDLEQLDAGLLLYDAFYRWCRDATRETHNWPTNKAKPYQSPKEAIMKNAFKLLVLAAAMQWGHAAIAAGDSVVGNKTIVFVCLHGSVKSQMAAAHFNRIARERGLPYTAISRGIETDASIPARIRDGLSQEGLVPLDDVPQPLVATEAAHALEVVAFDAVPDERRGLAAVNYWSDVPPATRNYDAARDAIVRHIENLVPALELRARSQETLEGVVTAVDERSDRITVRLKSDTTADFRVQDALVFNAIRFGDRVELTVETIDGARTIVGLRKE